MKNIAIIFVVLLFAAKSFGLGQIQPRLWEQVKSSDVIAHVIVEETSKLNTNEGAHSIEAMLEREPIFAPSHRARLRVVELIKGNAQTNIHADYFGNLLCPEPASFRRGEQLIVFLKFKKKKLVTNGLRYATRYPPSSELASWKRVLKFAHRLQKERRVSFDDWVSLGLSEPALHGEVFYSALVQNKEPYWIDGARNTKVRGHLSKRTRARLKEIFLTTELNRQDTTRLAYLLRDDPDTLILNRLRTLEEKRHDHELAALLK